MKFRETRLRRVVKAVEVLKQEKEQPFSVESCIPPEVWEKIRQHIPQTLKFGPAPYKQHYEDSMYFCLAFPEQCKYLRLGKQVETKLKKQLAEFKGKGHKGLWLHLLFCAQMIFPEKREAYSVERLWSGLLERTLEQSGGDYWTEAELLLTHPSLRDRLVTEEFIQTGKKMADKESEFYTPKREYPLLIFSPKYRATFPKPSPEQMKKHLLNDMKNIETSSGWYGFLMESMTLYKMLTADSIEFEGDTILFKQQRALREQTPELPEREHI